MIFRCVRLYTVRFLWIKDQNDICILFWIDKVVAWGSFHSNVLEFFVLAERFPNYISVIGRNGNTIQLQSLKDDVFLNTSRNITWLFKFYFTFYFVILQSEAISDFLLSFCVWHLSVYECHFREKYHMWTQKSALIS